MRQFYSWNTVPRFRQFFAGEVSREEVLRAVESRRKSISGKQSVSTATRKAKITLMPDFKREPSE